MKAAFRHGDRVFLRSIPRLALKAGQIRARVAACGVCGTDLHRDPGGDAKERVMTGHEVAGTVAEVGPAVRGLKVGQRIVLDSATPRGRCEPCRNARQELCTDIQSFFYVGSFGFAPKMVAPAACAVPCDDLDPAVACLQEPLGVAIDLVRLADLQITSNVLLLGQGPIGLMATALARRAGVRRLFATELKARRRRCALARRFGAEAVLDPRDTPIEQHDFGCAIDTARNDPRAVKVVVTP